MTKTWRQPKSARAKRPAPGTPDALMAGFGSIPEFASMAAGLDALTRNAPARNAPAPRAEGFDGKLSSCQAFAATRFRRSVVTVVRFGNLFVAHASGTGASVSMVTANARRRSDALLALRGALSSMPELR